MTQYVIRRLLQSLVLLVGITMLTFAIMQLTPGGPMRLMIDPNIDPAQIEKAEQRLGLDRPVIVQYFSWLGEVARGNLGYCIKNGRPVLEVIMERVPATIYLTGLAFVLSFAAAIPLGVLSATRRYSLLDYTMTVVSFAGISIPAFFFGLLLIFLFSIKLGWLPTSGLATIGADLRGWALLADRLKHVIMPALVLVLPNMATVMRYTRSSMLEVLGQEYVQTARAKGLSERVVIYRHALRNAMIPVITIFGLSLPFLFGGAFITETVFAWPGMGRLGIESVFAREYPVVMGINLFTSTLVLVGNLIADVLYAIVDPRIRYS